jgi:TatD DNase family protein
MSLIDSHCHLNTLDLSLFGGDYEGVFKVALAHDVTEMLSVCVEPDDYPALCALSEKYPFVWMSVGVHPNVECPDVIDASWLTTRANHPRCIAIGETGLDYYRTTTSEGQGIQQNRFRAHIIAAKETKKALIIHTREAISDTLTIMREEKAQDIGGVMHCFSEDWDAAKQALDMNFYISFSGILTFKNAHQLKDVAKKVPLERILIETDAPYLAPVPHRGQPNHPAWVKYVALELALLRGVDYETIAKATRDNFFQCFSKALDSKKH